MINMNISCSLKYNLYQKSKKMLQFYSAILAILCVFCIISLYTSRFGSNNLSMVDLLSALLISIFVAGDFKGEARLNIQNGFNRYTIFYTCTLSLLILSLCLSVFNTFLSIVIPKLSHGLNIDVGFKLLFNTMFSNGSIYTYTASNILLYFHSILWNLLLCIFLSSFALLMFMIFYRLNRVGKIVLSTVLVTAYIASPFLLVFLGNYYPVFIDNAFMTFKSLFGIMTDPTPYNSMIFFAIGGIVLHSINFLLIRTMPFREK